MVHPVLTRLREATETHHPLVIGHRGNPARQRENTLASFAAALACGADGIELDVQLSADGDVVVYHDADMVRLADDPRKIGTVDADELAERHQIPRLAEVLQLLNRSTFVDIELKSYKTTRRHRELIVNQTIAVVERVGRADQVLYSSFDPRLLLRVRRHAPRAAIAAIYGPDSDLPWYLRRGLGVRIARAHVAKPQASTFLSGRDAMRRPAIAWTVDAESEVRALHSRGIAGIITNDPAATISFLGNR